MLQSMTMLEDMDAPKAPPWPRKRTVPSTRMNAHHSAPVSPANLLGGDAENEYTIEESGTGSRNARLDGGTEGSN